VEGCTQTQWVRLTCFSGPGKCAVYRPHQVSIESLDGTLLEVRNDPRAALLRSGDPASWDELDVAYVCGLSIWNFVATPFLLTDPGVTVEELSSWQEGNQTWGRLRAVFPPEIGTFSPEQIFYFDAAGLQRRTTRSPIRQVRRWCTIPGRTRSFPTSSFQLCGNRCCCSLMVVSSPNRHSSISRFLTHRSSNSLTSGCRCGRLVLKRRTQHGGRARATEDHGSRSGPTIGGLSQ
jgi:hypothetical protein